MRPDSSPPCTRPSGSDFQREYGVDPLTLFDANSPNYWASNARLHQALIASRTAAFTRLHEEVLRLCAQWQEKKPYLHTTLTVVDSLIDTSMTERIGVDSAEIAGV